ncbi:MAG: hypothetical protein ABSC94_31305 [Polyangiaceae bacterium]
MRELDIVDPVLALKLLSGEDEPPLVLEPFDPVFALEVLSPSAGPPSDTSPPHAMRTDTRLLDPMATSNDIFNFRTSARCLM